MLQRVLVSLAGAALDDDEQNRICLSVQMASNPLRFIPLPNKPPNRIQDWQSLKSAIAEALLREMRGVQQYARETSVSRHDSIYTGLSGIAFMQYHIAKMTVPLKNEVLDPKKLTAAADRKLAEVLHRNPINRGMYSSTRLSFIETFIGIATLVLIRNPLTSEQIIRDNWRSAKEYLDYAVYRTLNDPNDNTEDGCEVLYGRAGLLYALSYLRNAIRDYGQQERGPLENLISDTTISKLVDSIVFRGKRGAHLLSLEFGGSGAVNLSPLMWSWHGKRYLGAAHGIAGILQLLLSCPYSLIQKHIWDIIKTAEWLAGLQDETGNWPTKSPDDYGGISDNELVQWCHGAPGVVMLLSKLIQVVLLHKADLKVDEETIGNLYRLLGSGAQLVYKRGLLRKGVGLCHGIGGNIYALLAASDILDRGSSGSAASTIVDLGQNERKYFAKAAHMAYLAISHNDPAVLPEMRIPDHPWSLYEGMAGMCCAWAEVLCRIETRSPRRMKSGFPAYDDL